MGKGIGRVAECQNKDCLYLKHPKPTTIIILYVILGIIALVLLIAAGLPGKYLIKKSIVINRPGAEVYNKGAGLNYYCQWNPWQKTDPDAKSVISGDPLHIGHKYEWNGKKVGEGSLTVRSVTPGKAINFDLRFLKPFKSQAIDAWDFIQTNEGTRIVWRNNGQLPFPVARLIGSSMNKQVNQQFEERLQSLKEVCEKN